MTKPLSGSRGKWKKKKRDTQFGRRNNYGNNNGSNRHEDEDEDEDLAAAENEEMERDNNDDSEDPQIGLQSTPNLSFQETELLSDDKLRVSEFPQVVKRAVTRPHSSVMAVVAMERANQLGETKGMAGNYLSLENVSYGQLQALSAMPADSPALLDQERVEAGNAAYVMTPPPIMEGRGVVKRFGSRVHVVPMHSGLILSSLSSFNKFLHMYVGEKQCALPSLLYTRCGISSWFLLALLCKMRANCVCKELFRES